MALYHKWDGKNGSAYVLQFFSLISEGVGGVLWDIKAKNNASARHSLRLIEIERYCMLRFKVHIF